MKCDKCGSFMKIENSYNNTSLNDYWGYSHGKSSSSISSTFLHCSQCNEVKDIDKVKFATDKQLKIINSLYYNKTSENLDLKEKGYSIFTIEEANKAIKFLYSLQNVDLSKYIDEKINKYVTHKLFVNLIKESYTESEILFEMLKSL